MTALFLSIIGAILLYQVIDYVGRYIACHVFAHKAHWHRPEDNWRKRTKRTASMAWWTLWNPKSTLISHNAYLIELVYRHPFKWELVDHWESIPQGEEASPEGDYP